MKIFRKILFIMCFFVINSVMYSQSINLLINQRDGIQESVKDISLMFENGVMDYLFDAGCIVSSEKIALEKDIKINIQKAIDSSVEGFFDYLVVMKLDIDSEKDEIKKVEWEVINISSSKSIGKGSLDSPKVFREKEVSIQRFGVKTGSAIYSCITGK